MSDLQSDSTKFNLFNPTQEHAMLREMVADFTKTEVEPQAEEFDRQEKFNVGLFRKLGELGLLGITVSEEYGGSGMDAVAAVIAHEELSYSDPGFALAYLAHAMLCANNLEANASEEQKKEIPTSTLFRRIHWCHGYVGTPCGNRCFRNEYNGREKRRDL